MRKVAILVAVVAMAVAFSAPPAMANTVTDFACTGTVGCGGGTFDGTTGSNITVTSTGELDLFTLNFTVGGLVVITENGDAGDPFSLLGVMTGFSVIGDTVDFGVHWFSLPPDLGGGAGTTFFPTGSVVSFSFLNNQVVSADIPVVTPEPATLGLLAAGFAGLGLLRKRKVA